MYQNLVINTDLINFCWTIRTHTRVMYTCICDLHCMHTSCGRIFSPLNSRQATPTLTLLIAFKSEDTDEESTLSMLERAAGRKGNKRQMTVG